MSQSFSYERAVDKIKLVYETVGFEINDGIPSRNIYKEFNQDVKGTHLGAMYAFLDEMIFIYRMKSYYFMTAIAGGETQAVVFYRLSIKILSTLGSIRLLCGAGLDSNARMQLRMLYETEILWCRLMLDEKAKNAFNSCEDPEAANKFWHEYISRGKSEKYIADALKDRNLKWLYDLGFSDIFQESKMKIGVFAHPSSISILFNAMDDWKDKEGENFVLKSPQNSSHFTISTAIMFSIIPFSFVPSLNYNFNVPDFLQRGPVYPQNKKVNNWDEYHSEYSKLPIVLFFTSIPFVNGLRNLHER